MSTMNETRNPRARTVMRASAGRGAVVGIDIGGSRIDACVTTPRGTVLTEMSIPTAVGGRAVLDQIPPLVQELERRASVRVTGVGVGATGIIEPGTGRVLVATSAFSDWVGHRLVDELVGSLAMPVTVTNDVKAFLLGEMRWGALRNADNALGVALGTGVGGAVAFGGRVVDGLSGGFGEIGHSPRYSDDVCSCGGVGHLETVASGPALGARYAKRTGTAVPTGREVAELARGGDADALAVIGEAGCAVADALLAATALLDISHVVLGGGVVGAWDLLAPPLLARIAANRPISGRDLIVRRSLATTSAIGAATFALDAALARSA